MHLIIKATFINIVLDFYNEMPLLIFKKINFEVIYNKNYSLTIRNLPLSVENCNGILPKFKTIGSDSLNI